MLEFNLSALITAKTVPTQTELTDWQKRPYFVLFSNKSRLFKLLFVPLHHIINKMHVYA